MVNIPVFCGETQIGHFELRDDMAASLAELAVGLKQGFLITPTVRIDLVKTIIEFQLDSLPSVSV